MKVTGLSALVLGSLLLTACQSPAKSAGYGRPVNIPREPHCALRTCSAAIPMLAPDAAPRIVHLYFANGLVVRHPDEFMGTIATSSNVASVELRTNLFSINATKIDVGRFVFDVHALEVPSIFIRTYTLRVIARNARGAKTEEDVPFRIL